MLTRFTHPLAKPLRSVRLFHLTRPYDMTPHNKKRNIVVVGGSYVGSWAAQFVAMSMHKTHHTILVEKNSHFQHLFAFPRFAVVPDHEHKAFIPFTTGFWVNTPPGSTSLVNAKVTDVLRDKILLDQGDPIAYDYLVFATGTKLSPPGSLETRSKMEGIAYFQNHQTQVSKAANITLIGGGAVGVQMATDIKDRFPDKTVTLVHSRTQLMNSFHPRLHQIVLDRCNKLGIVLILGDRVKPPSTGFPNDSASTFDVELTSGRQVSTNLAVRCTGQIPLSGPLRSLNSSSIDVQTGFVLVKPTLQITDARYPNIFALGDVASTGGHKAARPGLTQAQLVADNITRLASGSKDGELSTYIPGPPTIHLSLGLKDNVIFSNPSTPDGEPQVKLQDDGVEDMNCTRVWEIRAPGVMDYYL